jgi:Domain of unknown function (DUF4388)
VSESLRGDLRHFFPAEILQLLSLAQATGRLELERSGERAEIFVERGQPVFARTSGASVKVGQLLVHRGTVAAETLDRVLQSAASPGERIGARLVAAGAVTPDQIQGAVRETLRRVLYGLLLWREGSFAFAPGEQALGEDIRLDLDLDRLILEGLRQADESRRAS